MIIKWMENLDQRRIELLGFGYTYNEVAEILTKEFNLPITSKSVKNRSFNTRTGKRDLAYCKTTEDQIKEDLQTIDKFISMVKANEPQNTMTIESDGLFPEECYTLENEMCMTPEKIQQLKDLHEQLTGFNPKKILSLSDLHAPFINFKAVEQAILDNPDADICILNGDVYDGHAMSPFAKMKEFDIEVELNQVFTLLNVLTKKFKHVVWLGGNHDMRRFEKFVMTMFGASMRNYVWKRLNPMNYIAEKYDNLIIVPHDWVQVGDVVFAHLPNFSNVDMKTVVTNNEIFNALKPLLPNPNYRAIIIGHTHYLGSLIKNGVMLMEQGCLCYMQDYRFQKPTKNLWTTGYAIVEFDKNMKVLFNETKAIIL